MTTVVMGSFPLSTNYNRSNVTDTLILFYQTFTVCTSAALAKSCLTLRRGMFCLPSSSSFFFSFLQWVNTIALHPALPIPQCLAVGLAIIQGRTKQLAA